jgi:hypothetical protein
MANHNIDYGADNGEIVSTLNYLLSNLGNAPNGLTINRQTGQIINQGTDTLVSYLNQYLNIGFARNIQGLYFVPTEPAAGTEGTATPYGYYGIQNSKIATASTSYFDYSWTQVSYQTITAQGTTTTYGTVGTTPTKFLWYAVGGGRQISISFADTSPGANYVKYIYGTTIDLDVITFVGNSAVIGNNTVIGNYATIGTHANIGDYWTAGAFGNIGANLTVTNLITNSVLNTDTVDTTQIVNLAVTNGKLANNSVTSAKIQNFTIVDNDIANLTVTGSKIVDYTLVGTKLANATVTTQQIDNFTIVGQNIANVTITANKMNITGLSDITANAGNITLGNITGVGKGGTANITGFTYGVTNSLSNVAIANGTATTLTTFTVATPVTTRVMMSLTGTTNAFNNEANVSYYDAMSGNVILQVFYSNGTVYLTSTNFAQGTPTIIRQGAASFDYRIYNPTDFTLSFLMPPDTYTVKITPNWFYRNNTTGNLVTPTNETLTYVGRWATFQANIT